MAARVKKRKRLGKRCSTRICAAILTFSIAAFFRPVINLRRTLSESPRIVILGHYESEETILCRGVHGGKLARVRKNNRSDILSRSVSPARRDAVRPGAPDAFDPCLSSVVAEVGKRRIVLSGGGGRGVQASGFRRLGRTVRRDVPWAWGQNGSMASNAFHLRNQTPKSRPSHNRQL